jgi:1,4-alpha-glucan branching enzyme
LSVTDTRHATPDTRGALAIVLHSHMPYVEGFGTWPFGEEWLWEALATVYLPLLEVLRGQPVTLGLTPVLCDQLETLTGEAGQRFLAFLRDIRTAVHEMDAGELEREGQHEQAAELRRAAGDYTGAEAVFEALGGDLLGAFRALDGVELWTSAATHALLPLLATDGGRELQIGVGIDSHERRFEGWSGGFWLPECAYEPGLERELAGRGVRCFCVDQTDALGLGSLEHLTPVGTEVGPVAVPIDWQTIELIWGAEGYPSHPAYRDYHRRSSHDLRPWSNGGEPYNHRAALDLAAEHARDFVTRVIERLDAHWAERGRPGLVCCALDTELIGHWWYEGPVFLAAVLEEAPAAGLGLVTLPAALEKIEAIERQLELSSWGQPKDLSTWDSPAVAELAFAARGAELRTLAAASSGAGGPALERAVRELLALQASDWAFIATRELAGDYPRQRAAEHLAALDAALASVGGSAPPPDAALGNLAPALDLSPLVAP